jgi:carboxylate-amine ligase
MMVRQNKWRAARYGLDAQLVNFNTHKLEPARTVLVQLVEKLQPMAQQLGCVGHLNHIRQMAAQPTWAEQQMDIWKTTQDPAEIVRNFLARSRIG